MQYIFASDPHGVGQKWIDKVKHAQNKYKSSKVVFGGDYIDGAKFSKEVLDFVMDQTKQNNSIALLGNHEQLMIDFIEQNNEIDLLTNKPLWFVNGGKTTIKSIFGRNFSINKSKKLLKETKYYEFLKTLKTKFETENVIFVHAGIKENSNKDFELWARENYWLNTSNPGYFAHNNLNKVIVSGHTPTSLIYGKYDNGQKFVNAKNNSVLKIQYDGEKPKYFTDAGCHGNKNSTGNICVFDENGVLLEVI